MKKLISLAFVAMLSVLCFTSCSSSSKPEDVAKDFYTTMFEGGDLTQYLSPSVTPEEQKPIQAVAEMMKAAAKEKNAKLQKIEVIEVNEQEEKASVKLEVTVEYDDNGGRKVDTDKENFELKKIDGKWCIVY